MDQPLYSREEINKIHMAAFYLCKKELETQREMDVYKSKGINENFKKMISRENYDQRAQLFLKRWAPQLLRAIIVSKNFNQKATSLLKLEKVSTVHDGTERSRRAIDFARISAAKQLIELNSSMMNYISEFLGIQEEEDKLQLLLLTDELEKLNIYDKVSRPQPGRARSNFGKLYKGSRGGLYYKNKFGNKIYIKN